MVLAEREVTPVLDQPTKAPVVDPLKRFKMIWASSIAKRIDPAEELLKLERRYNRGMNLQIESDGAVIISPEPLSRIALPVYLPGNIFD